jgi:hypothetical protein
MKLIFIVVAFTLSQQEVVAEEKCHLTNKSQATDLKPSSQYLIGQELLICSHSTKPFKESFKSYDKSTLKIVRAHDQELKKINKLASAHGYHLINQDIDCQKSHCNHINIISLDAFNNIQKANTKPINLKGANNFQSLVNEINPLTWQSDIITLSSWSRVSGSSENNFAKTWIENKFNQLNLQVSTQNFIVNGNFTTNIIGVQAGSIKPDDWYIVGAHMDSTSSSGDSPGAVDNASGCAGVLEMARVVTGHTFSSTIIFICYSGEEQGLIGSNVHVNSIISNGNQNKVKAVLTMDMVGYTSNTNHELLLETSSSNQWLMDILVQNAAIYAPELTVYTSTNPFGSDHVPYINNNMHGILSIDEDWNVYPGYHRSTDLPENISLNQGQYILKTNLAALAHLAEIIQNEDVLFNNDFE